MAPANTKEKERFRTATDRLMAAGVSVPQIAERMRLSANHVFRWRRENDPRNPKPGWERVVADLARERADEIRRQLPDLEALTTELENVVVEEP